MNLGAALTFDDILIVPQYSEVQSRKLVSTKTNLTKNIVIDNPIVSANMDTVTELRMSEAMAAAGGVGVIHRFMTKEAQADMVKSVKATPTAIVGAAIGVKGDFLERAILCVDAGVDFLVLDVAHGHTKAVADALLLINELGVDVVAGNVSTVEGTEFLISHGASAVKVGVGPGSACTTRIVAGVGVPQFSAIIDCALASSEFGVPIIADGGIRYPGDVAKAIAAGASTVMVGGLLAKATESPGELVFQAGKAYKRFRGMASNGAMETARQISLDTSNGSSPEPRPEHITPAEGVEALVEYNHNSAKDIVDYLVGGLRSAMSYSNSSTIEEFQDRAKFVPITQAGLTESFPHDIIVQ